MRIVSDNCSSLKIHSRLLLPKLLASPTTASVGLSTRPPVENDVTADSNGSALAFTAPLIVAVIIGIDATFNGNGNALKYFVTPSLKTKLNTNAEIWAFR